MPLIQKRPKSQPAKNEMVKVIFFFTRSKLIAEKKLSYTFKSIAIVPALTPGIGLANPNINP